eukprot:GEZU01016618.1.p1 GENE.GEZU01016618.1~~GEZU01016618.1.p1  ORF type:complete len:272 (-),score=36.18 GEZU01016618.1:125-940(-)
MVDNVHIERLAQATNRPQTSITNNLTTFDEKPDYELVIYGIRETDSEETIAARINLTGVHIASNAIRIAVSGKTRLPYAIASVNSVEEGQQIIEKLGKDRALWKNASDDTDNFTAVLVHGMPKVGPQVSYADIKEEIERGLSDFGAVCSYEYYRNKGVAKVRLRNYQEANDADGFSWSFQGNNVRVSKIPYIPLSHPDQITIKLTSAQSSRNVRTQIEDRIKATGPIIGDIIFDRPNLSMNFVLQKREDAIRFIETPIHVNHKKLNVKFIR